MEYTEEMQSYLDIDWFAIDQKGHVMQFASLGGIIPQSVAKYKEDNEFVLDYFKNTKVLSVSVTINDDLSTQSKFLTEKSYDDYIRSAVSMAQKGLFAFYKSDINNFDDTNYHLVASPLVPLLFSELPMEIQSIIERTVFYGDVRTKKYLTIDEMVNKVV